MEQSGHLHHSRADDASFAIHKIEIAQDTTQTEKTLWYSMDHIGSVVLTTDATGNVSEAMSYDAHGSRREATWEAALLPIRPVDTPRGFTGHEQLDAVGIIHMNGRIYDPELGRMLSPDPNVPDPTITQEFNRYAYVRNNPLSYTDPTGFSLFNDDGSFAETPGGTGSPHSSVGGGGRDHAPGASNNSSRPLSNPRAVNYGLIDSWWSPGASSTDIQQNIISSHFQTTTYEENPFGRGLRNWFGRVRVDIFDFVEDVEKGPLEALDKFGNSFPQASMAKMPALGTKAFIGLATTFGPRVKLTGKAIDEAGEIAASISNKAPDFVVSSKGTAFPLPKGASGPVPVTNSSGQVTGAAFTGGKGGVNGQVEGMRMMNPTPPRGRSPGYPNGYVKYQNKSKQGVDPYSGQTIPNRNSHYPID